MFFASLKVIMFITNEGRTIMSTKKPFIGANVSPEVAKAIDEFYWENRYKSKAAAIEFILRAGMESLADEYPELDLNIAVASENDGNSLIRP